MFKKKIYTKEGRRSVRCFLWTQVSCSNQGPWALCNLNATYYCYITIYFVLTASNDIKIVLFEVGVIRRSCNRKLKTFLFYSFSFYVRFKTQTIDWYITSLLLKWNDWYLVTAQIYQNQIEAMYQGCLLT